MTALELYAVGCLTVASILFIWFSTALNAHIVYILGKLRLLKHPDLYTKDDTFSWLAATYPVRGELLTCPGCLSVHLSMWVSIGIVLLTGNFNIEGAYYVLCAVATWPFLSNRLVHDMLNHTAQKEQVEYTNVSHVEETSAVQQDSAPASRDDGRPIPTDINTHIPPDAKANLASLAARGIEAEYKNGKTIITYVPPKEADVYQFFTRDLDEYDTDEERELRKKYDDKLETIGGDGCTNCGKGALLREFIPEVRALYNVPDLKPSVKNKSIITLPTK